MFQAVLRKTSQMEKEWKKRMDTLNLKGVSARMKIVFKDINSLQRYSKILKAAQHTQQLVTFKPRVPLIHNDTWSLLIDLEELDK